MENSFDDTAVETINLLEAQLQRIEYTIRGHSQIPVDRKTSVAQRLSLLEHTLHQLASRSKTVQELLRLYSKYPDLFQVIDVNDVPTTIDTADILSIVMSLASAYSATASRLTSVLDVPVPPAASSVQLVELQPRIARIEALQTTQNSEIAELQERSAAIIQQWYTTDVLRAGDDWADLEGKVVEIEQKIERASTMKRDNII